MYSYGVGECCGTFNGCLAIQDRRASGSNQKIRAYGQTRFLTQMMRKQCGLVISPADHSGPMQRDWRDQHVGAKHLGSGSCHPARSRARQFRTIPMFQRQYQRFGTPLIHQSCPTVLPSAWFCEAVVAFDSMPIPCAGDRHAATFANCAADKWCVSPAWTAEAKVGFSQRTA